MQRISNRNHSQSSHQGVQVQYVDRIVEVEKVVHTQGTQTIVEVPVERIVEVEKIVHVNSEVAAVDLKPLHDKHARTEAKVLHVMQSNETFKQQIISELEMQRRALVGLKQQRDIDRSRRLMLIRRMRKEQTSHKKTEFKLKLAIGACLLISIASLIVKL